MKKNLLFGTICLSLFCGQVHAQDKPIYQDNSKSIDERVEDAVSRLTLEEKVAMLHANSKFGSAGCHRLGIPEIWMSDGPHGIRPEFVWDDWEHAGWTIDSCTAFPALVGLAATWNPEMAAIYGKAIGEEARYRNKDILLGPGVNIYRTPLNGRNFEYMGEDPYLASKMVVPYIREVQKKGVATCLKHFALNNQELWRGHINVEVSDRALHEIYLPAFKAGVQEGGTWSIMGSYNQFRGEHCCHNNLLLNKILREEWKFDGVVVSDWGGAHDTEQAVYNGLDIEMGTWTDGLSLGRPFAYDDYFLAKAYLDGIKNGKYAVSTLNEKVRRILRLIFRTNMSGERPYGNLASPEHAAVSRRIAEESIVLLKNEKNFFPVPAGKYKKIAVIGENAIKMMTVGGGSSELKVKKEVSPLEGLTNKYGTGIIEYAMGYTSEPDKFNPDSLRQAALNTAKNADIVLFIGGLNKNWLQDCEGEDRKSFELPYNQNELISGLTKANRNTAVVLISGNAVAMPWLKNIHGLIQSWYSGSEAGNAMANVIAGDVNPSGKLPFTIPQKLEDNSAHHFGTISYPGDSMNVIYKEDILVGYRWHDTKKIAPQFPFGYGLSYTAFDYGKPNITQKEYRKDEDIKLSFTLTNKGSADGAEVVQVYVSQQNPSVLRPEKELKAFKKVFLKAGETQEIELLIPVNELAFFDDKLHHWVVEPDKFILHIANSSMDIKRSVPVEVY
jgi:beta-glucosidase